MCGSTCTTSRHTKVILLVGSQRSTVATLVDACVQRVAFKETLASITRHYHTMNTIIDEPLNVALEYPNSRQSLCFLKIRLKFGMVQTRVTSICLPPWPSFVAATENTCSKL